MQDGNRGGVYVVRCVPNGRYYIGRTSSFYDRERSHWRDLENGSHRNTELQSDYLERGRDCFEFERVVLCDEMVATFIEASAIGECSSDPLCYNIVKPAAHKSPEWRRSIRISRSRSSYRNKAHERICDQRAGFFDDDLDPFSGYAWGLR